MEDAVKHHEEEDKGKGAQGALAHLRQRWRQAAEQVVLGATPSGKEEGQRRLMIGECAGWSSCLRF